MATGDAIVDDVRRLAGTQHEAGASDDSPGTNESPPDKVPNRNDIRRMAGSVSERRDTDSVPPDAPPSGRKGRVDRLEDLRTVTTPRSEQTADAAANRRKRRKRQKRRAAGGQTTGDKLRDAAKDDDGRTPGEKEPEIETKLNAEDIGVVSAALSIIETIGGAL